MNSNLKKTIDDILQEIHNDPLYFIERNGYELMVDDIDL